MAVDWVAIPIGFLFVAGIAGFIWSLKHPSSMELDRAPLMPGLRAAVDRDVARSNLAAFERANPLNSDYTDNEGIIRPLNPRCRYCGGRRFFEGPSGGMSTNIMCAEPACEHWFNHTPFMALDDLHQVGWERTSTRAPQEAAPAIPAPAPAQATEPTRRAPVARPDPSQPQPGRIIDIDF